MSRSLAGPVHLSGWLGDLLDQSKFTGSDCTVDIEIPSVFSSPLSGAQLWLPSPHHSSYPVLKSAQ